jgi:hypothetical protein
MGPLLRGAIDDEEVEGPKKEAIIVASCERDRWPAAVLACAASATEPTVSECLEQLPTESMARYEKALEKYATVGEEHDGPATDEMTTCDEAFAATAVDAWPPAVTSEVERPLATQLRGKPLRKMCEDQHWDLASRVCITSTPASGMDVCLAGLGDARRAEVERTLKEADQLRAKIVKAQAKPANLTCEKTVGAHYAATKWKGKAPELKGAARTKAIAASKTAMLASCKSWSIETRACIVADDGDACYVLAGTTGAFWGYPAKSLSSTLPLSGITECDDYAQTIDAIQACSTLPMETKQAIVEAYKQAAEAWTQLPPEAVDAARAGCKAAADAMRQAAASCT